MTLRSSDPVVDPAINLNFFENDLDLVAMREGVRFVDDIVMNGEWMQDIVGEDYPWPILCASDEAMNAMVLERSQTGFHPCGTCRLGQSITQGVVDGDCRVYGAKQLRVIDASLSSIIPDCRIQNVVCMVAKKATMPSRRRILSCMLEFQPSGPVSTLPLVRPNTSHVTEETKDAACHV